MTDRVVYCDRLTLPVILALLRRRLRGEAGTAVHVLDDEPGVRGRLLASVGYRVEGARFFAGHLRTTDGESVRIAARRITGDVAMAAADAIIAETPLLARLNARWGRGTTRLHLAKRLRIDIEPVIVRVLVAAALARESGVVGGMVFVRAPAHLEPSALRDAAACANVTPRFYRWNRPAARTSRLAGAAWLTAEGLRSRLASRTSSIGTSPAPERSVLLLEEDDLSLDRSYRTQPHFLFPGDRSLPFRLLVLAGSGVARAVIDRDALAAKGITRIEPAEVRAAERDAGDLPAVAELRNAARQCAVSAVGARRKGSAVALNHAARLFGRAAQLAAFCQRSNVRAFMTCESYTLDADAMAIVSEALPLSTLAYQYTNQPFPILAMLTTANRLLTFSPRYERCWTAPGVHVGETRDIGYVFDASFAFVRERAAGWRRRLEAAGATFVLCYFDESVQDDRYGFIHEDDHEAEIAALLNWVLADRHVALIVKVQFRRNSPTERGIVADLLARARASGRFLELMHGVHRNDVFPAEAALAADVAIGHALGATAALEAALVGTRSVIVNSYGLRSAHDDVYARGQIVFETFDKALASIRDFRNGDPACTSLGDWGAIIGEFDRFRDGRAATRLREHLEEAARA